MPRRRPRFSDLERQFREAGGVAAPNSRLEGYIKFKKGESRIKVTQKLTAAERKRYAFGILPFALTPGQNITDADRYAAPITAFSNAGRKAVNLSDNRLGYENVVGGTTRDDNFYAALIRVFVATSTTLSTPKSAVTGKDYNRIPGKTYSAPFGRTITSVTDKKTGVDESTLDAVDELDVRDSLAVFVKAQTNVRSVSFEPEVFKVGSPDLISPPA
jgi:hypothetical protein